MAFGKAKPQMTKLKSKPIRHPRITLDLTAKEARQLIAALTQRVRFLEICTPKDKVSRGAAMTLASRVQNQLDAEVLNSPGQ